MPTRRPELTPLHLSLAAAMTTVPATALADDAMAHAADANGSTAWEGAATRIPATGADTTYTVKYKDTISGLAKKFGVSQAAIVEANNLSSRHEIRVGQKLTIPAASPDRPHEDTAGDTAQAGQTATSRQTKTSKVHLVVEGDTLSEIARDHGTTTQALRDANSHVKGDLIRVGDKIAVAVDGDKPAQKDDKDAATEKAEKKPAAEYTVKRGDTLGTIARDQGVSIDALRTANPDLRGDIVVLGSTLNIPGGKPSADSSDSSKPKKRKVATSFAGRTYPPEVTRAAQKNLDTLMERKVPSKAQMKSIIRQTALSYGVDPSLALAIAHQESGFNMQQVSPANAIGAMQVIPSSGRWASQIVGRNLDLLDPRDNATAGVVILKANLDAAENIDQGIGGYYQGLGSIRSRGMYSDTRRYVANVRTLSARF